MGTLVAEADVSGPASPALPASVPVRLRYHLVLPQLHRPVVWKLQAPARRRMRKGSFTGHGTRKRKVVFIFTAT